MNKRFLISWVVVFFVWMVASFLVHGAWLSDTYAGMTSLFRTEEAQMELFHFMLLAHALMAGAFVWIYQLGQEDKPWLQQGLRYGAAIALLAPIPTYMIYYTVQRMPGELAVKQIVGDSLTVVAMGVLVAFLSRGNAARR